MSEIEKLLKEREEIDAKIYNIENQGGEEFDHSCYVGRYFNYLNKIIHVKEWTGSKYDKDSSYFSILIVTDACIQVESRILWFMSMEEIIKKEFDIAFNNTLMVLRS